jgi:peroxiredoxin
MENNSPFLQLLLWCSVIAIFSLLIRLNTRLQNIERMFSPRRGLPIDRQAPDFTAHDLDNMDVNRSIFLGKRMCLVFVGLDCVFCKSKYPIIRQLIPQANVSGTEIAFVCQCTASELQILLRESSLDTFGFVSLPEEDTLWDVYNPLGGIPYFVVVDSIGEIRAADYVGSDAWDKEVNTWIA